MKNVPKASDVICIIPARMSSTRFPGKPLAMIQGRELVLRMAEIASKCRIIGRVIIATEDEVIHQVCVENGYEATVTASYQTCTHRVAEVASDLACKYVVNLQGDEPLIEPRVLSAMIEFHIENKNRVTQAVYPIEDTDINDPDCVKCIVNNGHVVNLTRRPEKIVPNLFGIGGLYVYNLEEIQRYPLLDLSQVEVWGGLDTLGFIGAVDVVPYELNERTQAVDRPSDIEKVERCLRKNIKKQ